LATKEDYRKPEKNTIEETTRVEHCETSRMVELHLHPCGQIGSPFHAFIQSVNWTVG